MWLMNDYYTIHEIVVAKSLFIAGRQTISCWKLEPSLLIVDEWFTCRSAKTHTKHKKSRIFTRRLLCVRIFPFHCERKNCLEFLMRNRKEEDNNKQSQEVVDDVVDDENDQEFLRFSYVRQSLLRQKSDKKNQIFSAYYAHHTWLVPPNSRCFITSKKKY